MPLYGPIPALGGAVCPCPSPVRTKGYRFIQNANTEAFYQVDDWSDDLERDNLSARIHIHRLAPRWREALEWLKAKAGS